MDDSGQLPLDLTEMATEPATQLDLEWTVATMSRELLHVALGKPNPPTYDQSLLFAAQIAPEIFDGDSVLLAHAEPSVLAAHFVMEAAKLSALGPSPITPQRLAIRARDEAEAYLVRANSADEKQRVRTYVLRLNRVVRELEPSSDAYEEGFHIWEDTEIESLPGDPLGRNMPAAVKGKGFRVFMLENGTGLRVKCIHETKAEARLGGDLLLEVHDLREQRVRIAVLQYKMISAKRLTMASVLSANLSKQVDKMSSALCEADYCIVKEPQTGSGVEYRLPPCAAFLRPTEALQTVDAKMASVGHHIPACLLELHTKRAKESDGDNNPDLTALSITSATFEDLLNSDRAGSSWVSYAEAKALYDKYAILRPGETIRLHAQILPSSA